MSTIPPGRSEVTTPLGKIKLGDSYELSKSFTQEDVQKFSQISLDMNPIHLDPTFAATTQFKKPIVHGMLSASLISACLAKNIPGAIYLNQTFKFKRPVYIGETVTAVLKLVDIHERKPILSFLTQCKNQQGEVVVDGEGQVLVEQALNKQ